MITLSQEVQNEAKACGITIRKIDNFWQSSIALSIKMKFLTKNNKSGFLWEKFDECSFYNSQNAWHLIKDFVRDDDCILFFNPDDEKGAFQINDGNDLDSILSNSFGFEFYITNSNSSYVVAFNHHDFLIGCGTAYEWVKSL